MPEEKIFTLKLTADGLEVSSPNSEPKKPEPKVCGESDIHEPRWNHWYQRKLARVWHATLLGMNVEPSGAARTALKILHPDQYQDYLDRLDIAKTLMGYDLPYYEDHVREGDAVSEKYVALVDYYEFASKLGWTGLNTMRAFMGSADDGTPADACVAYYTELNRAGANIKWKVFPGAHHNFDGSTQQTYLAQGVTAKNCSIEVFLTDVKGGGLGEARDYKTGAVINGFGEWNKAFSACNSRGFTVAANASAKDQALKEVIDFVKGF